MVSTNSFFTFFAITQDLNKIKKIPHAKFQQKILNYMVVGAQRFQFFKQKNLVSWK